MNPVNPPELGQKGYPHAKVLNSGPAYSRLYRLLCGPVDMFITVLSGHRDLLLSPGPELFVRQARVALTGRLKRTQIILPVNGHEDTYWEDAVRFLKKPEPPEAVGHEWSKDRLFIVLTSVAPIAFADSDLPLVSIDVTEVAPYEVWWLTLSIGRLCSKNRFIPKLFGLAGSFAQPLFQQRLEHLGGADQRPRRESALDILSLPALISPCITVDFKYFKPDVRQRYDSICEETIWSRPGALPWSTILEERKSLKEKYWRSRSMLREEQQVRMFWD